MKTSIGSKPLLSLALAVAAGCSGGPQGAPPQPTPVPTPASVHDFRTCVDAGGPVLRTQPPRCVGPDGKTYVSE